MLGGLGYISMLRRLAGYAGSAVVGFLQAGAGAFARYVQDKLRERKTVLDFIPLELHAGIAARTNTSDLTIYLQAANDACEAAGAKLVWTDGEFLFSTLTQDKAVPWEGQGWTCLSNAAFGSAEWADASKFTGTVLRSTTTAGVGLTFTDANDYQYRMEGMILLGPGSGTSTGIKIGTAANASAQGRFVDVQVANFSQGWDLNALNEYTFEDCRSRGNSSGWLLQNAVNNCHFNGFEIQHSTVKGVVLNNGSGNTFTNTLLQNISGTNGLEILRGNDNNHFNGGWAEGSTATWLADIGTTGAGSASASFVGWRTSVTNGFNVDNAVGTTFLNCRFLSGGITITANALGTNLIGVNATVVDGGAGTVRISQVGGIDVGNKFIEIGTTNNAAGRITIKENGTPGAPAADSGTLFVRDTGAGKSQLCIRFSTGAVQVIATEP